MKQHSIDTLRSDGDWLCFDFINTVHDYTEDEPYDYLASYKDLLDWLEKNDLLTAEKREELESFAMDNRKKADDSLQHFLTARKTLYHFFSAIARNEIPAKNIQADFNALLEETLSRLRLKVLQPSEVQFHWDHQGDLTFPLAPVIKSAYDLLTSDMLDRIKECGACGWLFLDRSKNQSRKWCSMETCGSNVKAKRYYHKSRND